LLALESVDLPSRDCRRGRRRCGAQAVLRSTGMSRCRLRRSPGDRSTRRGSAGLFISYRVREPRLGRRAFLVRTAPSRTGGQGGAGLGDHGRILQGGGDVSLNCAANAAATRLEQLARPLLRTVRAGHQRMRRYVATGLASFERDLERDAPISKRGLRHVEIARHRRADALALVEHQPRSACACPSWSKTAPRAMHSIAGRDRYRQSDPAGHVPDPR